MTDPDGLPDRRSMRLRGYDYAAGGVYFLTVCTADRACLFGEVVNAEMRLNEVGTIVRDCWDAIAVHNVDVEIDDAFVVMPNHVHGVLRIAFVGATHASPVARCPDEDSNAGTASRARGPSRRSVGSIVGAFKSAAARRINQRRSKPSADVWQRGYHEHVIRNDASLERIRQYIADNPAKWHVDPENPRRGPETTKATEPWCV